MRIPIDEFPKPSDPNSRSDKMAMVVFVYKRPQTSQRLFDGRGYAHRKDTAACVSLSNSTMSKTCPEVPNPPITPGGGEERGL